MMQRGDNKGGNSSAEEKEQLSNVLSDILLRNAEHQSSMNELSQYLEMQWMNDRNPDVQVARITPDQGDAASVELEGYSTVLASLEQLVADVSTMSNNIESRLERDTYSVQALTGRLNILHARIRSIAERKVRRSYDKSASTSDTDSHHPGGVKGGKRHVPTSSSVAIHRPYEPSLLPLWSPAAVGTAALCLNDKSNVFHRKALVSRLTTAEYYQNSTLDEEERQELQEEIAHAEAEIRRESELSEALEAMANLSIQQQQQQQQQQSAGGGGGAGADGVVGVGGASVASLLANPPQGAAAAVEGGGNKASDSSSVGSKKGDDAASVRRSVTKGGGGGGGGSITAAAL